MEDQKVFPTAFDTVFHVYLRRGLQKHARNSNPMIIFKLSAIQSFFESICVAINYQNAIVGIKFLLQSPHRVSCKHHKYVVKRYKYFLWYPIGLGVMDTLCCISLRSLAYF